MRKLKNIKKKDLQIIVVEGGIEISYLDLLMSHWCRMSNLCVKLFPKDLEITETCLDFSHARLL